jgi:hypothetical protein
MWILPSPCCGEATRAFEQNSTLGIRDVIVFVAAVPRPARSRAYASTTPLPGPAQGSLPTRWVGSPRVGRDSHPLDDERNFSGSSHTHLPSDWPCLVALFRLSAEMQREAQCIVARERDRSGSGNAHLPEAHHREVPSLIEADCRGERGHRRRPE